MTVRTDITVNWGLSPRLITVAAPSTEVVLQDLVDTLRSLEDDIMTMDEDDIISAAGKETLGGGVTVGITATLLNARLSFASRPTAPETGTVTTADANGVTLTDSTATFQTNGILAGATVMNQASGASATVLSVDSETQLTLEGLGGGTRQTFVFGDDYSVYNIVQCNVSGGNLVAVDAVDAELDPIFPSAWTQVVRTASSSATTQSQAQLEFATFNGGVTIDVINGVAGTAYPTGTPGQPSNNVSDAHTIQTDRGFRKFFVVNDLTLSTEDFSEGVVFEGLSSLNTTLTLGAGTNVDNCIFRQFTVTGVLDNNNRLEDCLVDNMTSFDGILERCGIESGGVTLGGTSQTTMNDCYSNVPGTATPTINIGSGSSLAVRGYKGGVEFTNKTGTDAISVDMLSGNVIVASSCTAGTITLRGTAELENNTGGTYVRDFMQHNTDAAVLKQLIESQRPHHTGTGKVIYWNPYDGDDTRNGDHIDRAVLTFAQAHTLAADNGHDTIVAVAGDPSGTTVTTENVAITKNYLFLRGPGRDFTINSTNDALDAINISGNGVEVSGMIVTTTGTNTKSAIATTGNFTLIENVWCTDAVRGITFTGTDYGIVNECRVSGHTNYGILVEGASNFTEVKGTLIATNGGSGIDIDTTGVEVLVGDCDIHNNGAYGVDIAATASDVFLQADTVITTNTTGAVNDLGTDTYLGYNTGSNVVSILAAGNSALTLPEFIALKD